MLHLTDRRFALQLSQEWADIPFSCIRASHCDERGIALWYEGCPPARLELPAPQWHFVLFRFFAYGETPDLRVPDDLARRAARGGYGVTSIGMGQAGELNP